MSIISPFVLGYVLIDAYRLRKKLPPNIKDILKKEIADVSCGWNGKVLYAWFWSAGVHVPNASATIPGMILINAEWASQIVLNQDNPYMHDAVALRVCHEMTHHEGDFHYFDLFTSEGKFVNWINEVHADYGGVQKGLESHRARAILAMKYKLSCKHRRDKDTRSHPSWNKRIGYIQKYNFNDTLIDKIAFDCGCNNEKLIVAVKNYFGLIELRGDDYEIWY